VNGADRGRLVVARDDAEGRSNGPRVAHTKPRAARVRRVSGPSAR
jgi:hypothetical protein